MPSKLKTDIEFKKDQERNISIYKRELRGLLPNYILNHSKTGWRFPTDEILIGRMDATTPDNGVLKDYIRETLDDKELMDIFEYDMTDVEERYLNNRHHIKTEKG